MIPIILRVGVAVAAAVLGSGCRKEPYIGRGDLEDSEPIRPIWSDLRDDRDRGGCQASRTAQLPTVDLSWFGRKLTQVAARFAGVPPMFVSGK